MTAETAPTRELALELSRHARLLHTLKGSMASHIPAGLDGAAFGVLMSLSRCGPRRQGELAELTFLDPSTISRYVTQLVKAGLVSRRPDPSDGRAVQLVPTPEGAALAAEAVRQRQALIDEMIEDWSPDDATTLVRLLRRLNDALEVRRGGEPPGRAAAGA
jgi:DNA-binding MarR family transcriptional regulator